MSEATRPLHFPDLPLPPDDLPQWSNNVDKAHTILCEAYEHGSQLLRQEDGDPLRLRLHSERIYERMVPILEALEPEVFNKEWIVTATDAFALLMVELEGAALAADQVQEARVERPQYVHIKHARRRGRPRKIIDFNFLKDAMSPSRRLKLKDLAEALGMHRNTLYHHLKAYGLARRFSEIPDTDIDILIRHFKSQKPSSGLSYVIGFFRRHGIRVQRRRLHQSLRRIDGLGQTLRNHAAIDRRRYKVPRPNHLWHLDGHHKLIKWGIVIHGVVDGYCRTIVQLRASTNNRASTVLDVFHAAVCEYGIPSRARGDRGGENVEVSVWMVKHRGINRASFLWGSSTRNTRIERLWVEVGTQFARRWRAFFLRLERLHHLDRDNPTHLWLLHHLFLESINKDCNDFRDEWNHHPISGLGKGFSPKDLRMMGELKHGRYVDDFDGIQPEVLQRYYGVHGSPDLARETRHAGAGIPDDDFSDLDEMIAADLESNVRHDPIEVPSNESPFDSHDAKGLFEDAFRQVDMNGIIPPGFGVLEDEWEEGIYEAIEPIKLGRAGKYVDIPLPFDVWWPRAVRWAQGLDIMNRIVDAQNYAVL